MSHKSKTYADSKSERPKRTYFGTLMVIVLLALTISFSVALLIAYLTPYVSPTTFGSLTIVGIFVPILYIGVVICTLLWLVMRYWRVAGIAALMLIPGAFHVQDFYNLAITRQVEGVKESGSFTLMSYNVRGFYSDKGEYTIPDIVDYMEHVDAPDIVCLQEFSRTADGVERIDSLFAARYKTRHFSDVVESGNYVLRIYSRYPIIAKGEIAGSGRGTSQWVDVVVNKRDTLRVFNNHLYTTQISPGDSEEIERGRILQDGGRIKSIVDRIANNSAIRASHVDTLRYVMDNTPHDIVVCGDFNDTPMSYVYGELSENLKDAFVESGRGYGYTFRPMYGMLRIDYILHSAGLKTVNYFSKEDVKFSDHLPIVARLKFE